MKKKDLLTITATEWAKITGNSLRNFVASGFQSSGMAAESRVVPIYVLDDVPRGAKVVVSYKVNVERVQHQRLPDSYSYNASGTALIPKKAYRKSHKR